MFEVVIPAVSGFLMVAFYYTFASPVRVVEVLAVYFLTVIASLLFMIWGKITPASSQADRSD